MMPKSTVCDSLNISFAKLDTNKKLGSMKLSGKDVTSAAEFVTAFQRTAKDLSDGTYTLYCDDKLFARLDVKQKQVSELHKWSKNTGMKYPCWSMFKE